MLVMKIPMLPKSGSSCDLKPTTIFPSTVQYSTVQHSTVQYSTVKVTETNRTQHMFSMFRTGHVIISNEPLGPGSLSACIRALHYFNN